jgi:hypothetical protein
MADDLTEGQASKQTGKTGIVGNISAASSLGLLGETLFRADGTLFHSGFFDHGNVSCFRLYCSTLRLVITQFAIAH